MSNELRAAANRVKKFDLGGGYESLDDDYFSGGYFSNDVKALMEFVLASLPADDELAITEEWLRSEGWVWVEAWQKWAVRGEQSITLFRSGSVPHDWTLQYECDFCWPHGLTIRGHLRRLLAALGVTQS